MLGYTGANVPDRVQTCRRSPKAAFRVSMCVSWYGFFVPAKTPTEIITKMNADTIAALADPSVHGRLAGFGYEVGPTLQRVSAFYQSRSRNLEPRHQASRHRPGEMIAPSGYSLAPDCLIEIHVKVTQNRRYTAFGSPLSPATPWINFERGKPPDDRKEHRNRADLERRLAMGGRTTCSSRLVKRQRAVGPSQT